VLTGLARRVAATTLIAASFVWVNPVQVNAADPVGWRLAFSAAFDRPPLPSQCEAYDGPHQVPSASYFRPDEVTIVDDTLRLGMRRRDFGGRPYTTGGVRCPHLAQQYGRYEVRARAPLGTGIAAAIGLDGGAANEESRLEILAKPGDERLVVVNRYGSGETTKALPGSYSADYHTYLIEWAPSGYRVSVDGHEVLVDAHVSTARRWPAFEVSSGEPRTGLPDASTVLPAAFVVDWITVWAYDPTAPDGTPSSTGSSAGTAAGPARNAGGGHWSGWLAAAAVVAVLLVGVGYVMRRTRPHRPPPAHRA
jgi:beta-glucanase (GH16 family)